MGLTSQCFDLYGISRSSVNPKYIYIYLFIYFIYIYTYLYICLLKNGSLTIQNTQVLEHRSLLCGKTLDPNLGIGTFRVSQRCDSGLWLSNLKAFGLKGGKGLLPDLGYRDGGGQWHAYQALGFVEDMVGWL